jgi:hypothetical protein
VDSANPDSPDPDDPAPDDAPPSDLRRRGRWLTALRGGFSGELLVVVLGVLIALGVGEAADMVRWQMRVSKANLAIRSELARAAGVFEERNLVQPCLVRRLTQLDTILRAARRSGRLPQIGKFGRPPIRPVERTAWDMTSSSETLLHLKERDRNALVAIYAQLSGSADQAMDEQDLWATLGLLENAPGPIASDLLAEASTALEQLKFRTSLGGANAGQLFTIIRQEGVAPSYWMVFGREADRGELLASVAERHICRPLQVQEPYFSKLNL